MEEIIGLPCFRSRKKLTLMYTILGWLKWIVLETARESSLDIKCADPPGSVRATSAWSVLPEVQRMVGHDSVPE